MSIAGAARIMALSLGASPLVGVDEDGIACLFGSADVLVYLLPSLTADNLREAQWASRPTCNGV